MSSRARIVGVTVGSIAVGLVGGFLFGQIRGAGRSASSPSLATRGTSDPQSPASPGNSLEFARHKEAPSADDRKSLADLARSQRDDIGRLVDELARTKIRTAGGEQTRQRKRAIAKKVYETSMATYAHPDEVLPQAVRELNRMRDGLDAEMTSYFVERYREETAKDPDRTPGAFFRSTPRRHAWFLVFAAGGDDAARFLKEWMSDPATSREDRASGLDALSSVQLSDDQNLEKVPVDASLAEAALPLAQSDLEGDRKGAADLLGRYDTPASRDVLRRLADSDPVPEVRAVALRSLGRIGTRETLEYLRAYPVPSVENQIWEIKVSLAESITELTLKFPQ